MSLNTIAEVVMTSPLRYLLTGLVLSSFPLCAAVSSCRPMNSFEQGHELKQSQLMAAYNAPARIDVRGSWDLYFTGSYIFWQPSEENLELGISNASSTIALPIKGHVVNADFKYKSGLQVGMGIFSEMDNWDGFAEYTWLSGRHTSRSNGPVGGGILPFWGHPANVPDQVLSTKGRWKLSLNVLDLNVGRSYYIGTRLTFRPYFGARPTWINQKEVVTYATSTSNTYQIRETTTSWGIGPEVGLDTSWLLGYGIRLIGKAETDLLFTSYNLRYKEQDSASSALLAVDSKQRHLYALRPHMDLRMGLGWGSYLNNFNYHFDIAATYDFQIFWNQNMFRKFSNSTSVGTSSLANGDLFLQGVTGTVRFDF